MCELGAKVESSV